MNRFLKLTVLGSVSYRSSLPWNLVNKWNKFWGIISTSKGPAHIARRISHIGTHAAWSPLLIICQSFQNDRNHCEMEKGTKATIRTVHWTRRNVWEWSLKKRHRVSCVCSERKKKERKKAWLLVSAKLTRKKNFHFNTPFCFFASSHLLFIPIPYSSMRIKATGFHMKLHLNSTACYSKKSTNSTRELLSW